MKYMNQLFAHEVQNIALPLFSTYAVTWYVFSLEQVVDKINIPFYVFSLPSCIICILLVDMSVEEQEH